MSARFHGVMSISLVGISILIAIVTVFQATPGLGLVYLAGCALAPFGIVYAFCAKCPCRTCCAHIVFGKLAVALTHRQPGPYTPPEVGAVGLALLWLLCLPQLWLWQAPLWLALFWLLNAVALVQIHLAVCPACDNAYCPLRSAR
ncbi:MAG: hypothetical protein JXA93_11515 [Anaerolineae bacterium]|nr:hypothetical protein [Anaerolineae bacterium]